MLYGTIVWANYFFNLPIISMSKRNLTFLFASSTVLFLGVCVRACVRASVCVFLIASQ